MRIVLPVVVALWFAVSTTNADAKPRAGASRRPRVLMQARASQSRRTEEAPGKALLCAYLIAQWQGAVSGALSEVPPSATHVKSALDQAGNLVDITNLLDVTLDPNPIAVTNYIADRTASTTQNEVKAYAGRWMLQLKLPFMADRVMLSSAAAGEHLGAVSNLTQALATDGKSSPERVKETLDTIARVTSDVQSLPIADRKPALQYLADLKDGFQRLEKAPPGSTADWAALHAIVQRTENEILKQLAQLDAVQSSQSSPAAGPAKTGGVARQPSNLDEALRTAAAGGTFFELADLIQRGANVNSAEPDTGETPLMWAVEGGNPAKVSQLLTHHANVNTRDSLGETALMKAVSNGRADLVQTLMAAGASVNVKAEDGTTALMIAAAHDSADIVKILLAKKADMNAKDSSGRTALSLAQQEGNKAIVTLLKNAGAK